MEKLNKDKMISGIFFLIIMVGGIFYYIYQTDYNQAATREFLQEKSKININESKVVNELINSDELHAKKEETGFVIVHIDGEVNRPGVYKLKEKSRVIDVLQIAGGETELADLYNINLASLIDDGQKITIPGKKSEKTIGEHNNIVEYNDIDNKKINLNRANIEDLQKLSGIGKSKAQSIINYRKKIDKFTNINQLLEIRGIGERTLENIKDELTL